MVHYIVPGIVKFLYGLRIAVNPITDHKEGCFYFVFFQYAYQVVCIFIAPGSVKADGADLILTFHIVNRQFPRSLVFKHAFCLCVVKTYHGEECRRNQ